MDIYPSKILCSRHKNKNNACTDYNIMYLLIQRLCFTIPEISLFLQIIEQTKG